MHETIFFTRPAVNVFGRGKEVFFLLWDESVISCDGFQEMLQKNGGRWGGVLTHASVDVQTFTIHAIERAGESNLYDQLNLNYSEHWSRIAFKYGMGDFALYNYHRFSWRNIESEKLLLRSDEIWEDFDGSLDVYGEEFEYPDYEEVSVPQEAFVRSYLKAFRKYENNDFSRLD